MPPIDDEPNKATGSSAELQLMAVRESQRVRELYDETGELQSLDEAPAVNVAWHAAQCAVRFASDAGLTRAQMPKTVNWLGIHYRILFPDHGPVQIIDPTTNENLCYGLKGWTDLTKIKPKPRA